MIRWVGEEYNPDRKTGVLGERLRIKKKETVEVRSLEVESLVFLEEEMFMCWEQGLLKSAKKGRRRLVNHLRLMIDMEQW